MNKVTKVVAILMTVAVVAIVFAFNNVFATGVSLPMSSGNGVAATGTTTTPPAGTAGTTGTNGSATLKPATNTTNTTNTTSTNTTNTTNTTKNTVANTNTINNNLVKDKEELPKTGEFDVYIISVVAVVVVLVGGFAFVKSRKIN
ncbi:MAG: LPXTG cell wall anchor domain-containing protein [Clostridiales bacterium]|jgi:anaphase-promoting complex subunit cdh1|nr:LPXTG cell wall anchor domain-containing protein [Clostridiales bacterium]MBF0927065.1 LPXTG cell wall anchor domain-containing protein [Clostridiales bacterium]MBF0986260.1 LPXTG cell wall anchor domain-containing protein [Clostridiales bacterium]